MRTILMSDRLLAAALLHALIRDSEQARAVEIIPKPHYYPPNKSKGEKKRQRSQWNSQIKGYRK